MGVPRLEAVRRWNTPDDLWASAVPDENGCWVWQKGRTVGYGKFRYRGESWLAHRLAYTLAVGPIPDGLSIDHLCRNRACINPEHLDPCTLRENSLRAVRPVMLKTHCLRGHPYDAENTYVDKRGRRSCRACGREAHRASSPTRSRK